MHRVGITLMNPLLDNVDVREAGDKIIVSSEDREAISRVMELIEAEGGCAVQKPVKLGRAWIASFDNPAVRQCDVERAGFRIILSGPTRSAVTERATEFTRFGAAIEHGPTLEDGTWKLYLDDAVSRIRK
jgi:hypothetical protein